jgi:hypothetical protein
MPGHCPWHVIVAFSEACYDNIVFVLKVVGFDHLMLLTPLALANLSNG